MILRKKRKRATKTPPPVHPAAVHSPTVQPYNVPIASDTAPGVSVGVPRGLAKYGLGSWYLIGIVIIVSLFVFATARISFVFVGIFLALVATSVLRPVTDFFARWMPRALAMILSFIAAFAIFGGLIGYVVYSVQGEWDELADTFSSGIDSLLETLENSPLPWDFSAEDASAQLSDLVDTGIAWLQDNAGEISAQVMSSASAIGTFIMIVSLAALATIFFLMSGAKMWLWFLNQLPDKNRDVTHRAASAAWLSFSGYARGTVIVAVLDGVLAFILLLILQVPLAAPLAILVTIGAFIPLFGAPIAMIIATIVAFAANGPVTALIVLLGVALIGQLEGDVFQPLVMGKQVSLHPLVIAIAVLTGTFLAGLVGAIIAIPILSSLWAMYKVVRRQDPPREKLPEANAEQLLEKDR